MASMLLTMNCYRIGRVGKGAIRSFSGPLDADPPPPGRPPGADRLGRPPDADSLDANGGDSWQFSAKYYERTSRGSEGGGARGPPPALQK